MITLSGMEILCRIILADREQYESLKESLVEVLSDVSKHGTKYIEK